MEKGNKLDLAPTASMDLLALNNLLVSMRGVIKQAKVQIIHKITRNAKALRDKKGNEEVMEKNKRRAERLVGEIEVLKNLSLEKAAKFSLSNTETFDQLVKRGEVSIQHRALVRLADHQNVQKKVKSWRNKHEDWKSLAAVIMSKNTGRRFKNKKKKHDGINIGIDKILRGGGDTQDDESDDSEQEEEMTKTVPVKEKMKVTISTDIPKSDQKAKTESTEVIPVIKPQINIVKQICDSKSKKKPTQTNKQMVVKKLNISNLDEELKEIAGKGISEDNDVPEFLLSNKSESEEPKKKIKKDSFFVGDNYAADSNSEEEDSDNESIDDEDNGVEDREDHQEKMLKHGKGIIESVFLGNLGNSGKQFKQMKGKSKEKQVNPKNQKDRKLQKPNVRDFGSKSIHSKPTSASIDKKESGGLHPSWEASRKRKLMSSIQSFQGKKIKFEDSD